LAEYQFVGVQGLSKRYPILRNVVAKRARSMPLKGMNQGFAGQRYGADFRARYVTLLDNFELAVAEAG